jgi:cytoskeletal protein RodZ
MSESWNVETVAETKPETPPEKPPLEVAAAPVIPSVLSNEHSLGKIMAMAREARGFTREQAAKSSNIPGYYLTMIESDDYSSIADQLYLLPFLRRYAAFVALEPEEVASRFIRDVQRADMNPPRFSSEPIVMIADRKSFPWRFVMMAGGAIVIGVLGWFGYQRYAAHRASAEAVPVAPAAVEQPAPQPAASQAVAPQGSSQLNNSQQNGSNSTDEAEPDTAIAPPPLAPSIPGATTDNSSSTKSGAASSGNSVIAPAPAMSLSSDTSSQTAGGDQPAAAPSPNGHSKAKKHKAKAHS